MYPTYYDKLPAYFGQDKLQLHYMDCDSFVLSIETQKEIIDSKNLEYLFLFSNLDENHEPFRNKSKKVLGKFTLETPKNIWIDEFICFRSKAYSFKCNDENTNKIEGFSRSQSRNIKFEEYKKCLDGEKYQRECAN